MCVKVEAPLGTLPEKAARGRATRRTLLTVARKDFGARGYADASVEEIVRRAGVTKGAFYHHFTGKGDLFLRVFEDIRKELSRAAFITHRDHEPFAPQEAQSRRLNRFAEQSNAEVWNQFIERCRRYIELHIHPEVQRIVLVDARWVLDRKDWQRIESEHGLILLRADLRRAMQRRIIRRLPLNSLAVILSGVLNEACLTVADAHDREQALDEAMTIITHLLGGLREPESGNAG